MEWNQNHAFRGASTCKLLLTAREHWTQHDSRGRPIQPGSHQTKHGDVIVCATTACLRARLRTAPIRSRERQRADEQLLMTFCLKPYRRVAGAGTSPSRTRDRRPHIAIVASTWLLS